MGDDYPFFSLLHDKLCHSIFFAYSEKKCDHSAAMGVCQTWAAFMTLLLTWSSGILPLVGCVGEEGAQMMQ